MSGAPDPAEPRGPGSRRKGWENGESSYLYLAISSMRGESPHELDSQKLDDVSAVCGDSSLFFTPSSPNVLLETQRPLSVLATPSSQSSTCCSGACSDVALICRTCLSFTAFVSAVSQTKTVLGLKYAFTVTCFVLY